MLGAIVYHTRSERIDQFAHKRYSSPELERYRHVVIEAEVIEQQGEQVKLKPTAVIPGVPEIFVTTTACLCIMSGTWEIRQKTMHGPPSCTINEWQQA